MPLKFIARLFVLGGGIAKFAAATVVSEIVHVARKTPSATRQLARAKRIGDHAAPVLRKLGFQIAWKGQAPDIRTPHLVVANHLSFWDILFLSSRMPLTYVTSYEIRDTPFLGHLCRLGGCTFVNRKSRANIDGEIQELVEHLNQGLSIGLFPEGTSSNGERVLPFKKSMFRAAVRTERPVLPVCIDYRKLDGQTITGQNRDRLFYYGDIPFIRSFISILLAKEIIVEINVLDSLSPTDFPNHHLLADIAHQQIASHYTPIPENLHETVDSDFAFELR